MSSPKFAEMHNVVAFLEKPVESDGFTEIIDFLKASPIYYALTVNSIIYISCIEQFWATTKVQTVNGVRQLQALVDKKRVIFMESSIRRDLHLDDAEASEEVGEDLDHPTDSTQIPIIDQPSTSTQPKKKKTSKKTQRKEAEKKQRMLKQRKKLLALKEEDPEGRSIADLDKDDDVTLVDETQERQDDELMFDTGVLDADEMHVEAKFDEKDEQSGAAPTTIEEITLAQIRIQIKAAKPKVVTTAATTTTTTRLKARGVVVQEPSEFKAPQEAQPSISKDKGKGIMIKPEVPLKRKDQIALDEQIARDIQAKLDAELIEEQKLARKKEEETT
ncbi:hypothetical protein Tco_1256192 [Tanacetum coccineum]